MGRRPRWHYRLQASKAEALIAVDLYNRRIAERSLEGFIVHMVMAWTQLCHAIFERDGTDFTTRDSANRRIKIDGEYRLLELAACVKLYCPHENDPVRRNIEFFIPLRNRIEHRFAHDVESVVAGKIQSLVLNYERAIVAEFGQEASLQDSLRFPVFLSSITENAVVALKEAYNRLPRSVRGYIETYQASLPDDVLVDPAFDFRVYLIPKTSSRGESDLAVEFVRLDDVDEETRDRLTDALVIIRDRQVSVANLGRYKPKEVVNRVVAALPWFNMSHHTAAWHHFEVRPEATSIDPTATDQKYCIWDQAHGDYVYTEAWIRKLVQGFGADSETFKLIVGREPEADWYSTTPSKTGGA